MLEKFDEAFIFSKTIHKKNEFFFETNLLLGLNYFIKKNYIEAEKHFDSLNEISRYNIFFTDIIGNILIAWSKASQGKKIDSFQYIEKIPKRYSAFKEIQNIFFAMLF